MAISLTGFAQTKVVVIPLFGDDVPVVPTYKLVFVTNATFKGNLGGPEGADDKCQAEADSLPGSLVQGKEFKAWVSGDLATDFSAVGRRFAGSSLPYRLVGGGDIALNFNGITDGATPGRLLSPFNRTAAGELIDTIRTRFVWTGISNLGVDTGFSCANWTLGGGAVNATVGIVSVSSGSGWTQRPTIHNCGNIASLYCFEQ